MAPLHPPLHVVTGALGYTGRAVARRLLARGERVRTLTSARPTSNHLRELASAMEVRPLDFSSPARLEASLRDDADGGAAEGGGGGAGRGADVLYNTYWVRFNHDRFNFKDAVENTKRLFDAASRAGVGRVVHVSILHAEEADDLAYYRGKHELEDVLRRLGVPHAIIRPGVLFGSPDDADDTSDILINNIAWVLRHVPVFGVFGSGAYRLRPLHVRDMADLMIRHADATGNTQADAVGPESFAYRDLVRMLARAMGVRRLIVPVPPIVGLAIAKLLNPIVGDVIITREEIKGLMRGLLDSPAPAAGPTRLTDWAHAHRDTLGVKYASEVGRRIRP